ncbi:MAG: branched-chain amino acid transport system permease protein, partial [Thermoleophilaceae bacterium]|nr:branched-chain amino acid transport system permease protein [Thermoleophilaceae bacterium]
KMQALVLGGVIGGIAGMVDAIGSQSVQPDNYSTATTFFAYAALILGGAARVLGPIAGSMIFWCLLSLTDNVLRNLVGDGTLPLINAADLPQVRFMLVGIALMLLMIFRPQGIFGSRREVALDAR